MPDDLYERDILAWSDQQADLIRRLARGERVNDVDWGNLAEEVESVGRSELHSVESYLELIIEHALKLHALPDSDAVRHWHREIMAFQSNARRRFTPSMRQRIDLGSLYSNALRPMGTYGIEASWPATCPFTLDSLLADDPQALAAALRTP